ncbi:MAG: DUF805 domain-containing protein [Candidatus Pacebacteria bacterium]|nr:DUF805 domain-containing protein [Candidatus Paceibacterota bacterium]
MNFVGAIKSGFTNYFSVKGKATRSEFWYWQLFSYGLYFICLIIAELNLTALLIASAMVTFGLLIPNFLIEIRRLHDIGKSGHWLWLRYSAYFPIGLIVLSVIVLSIIMNGFSEVLQTVRNSAAGFFKGGLTGDFTGSNLDNFKFYAMFMVGVFTSNFRLGKIIGLCLLVNVIWGVAVWFWFAYLFAKPSLEDGGKSKNQPAVVTNPFLNRPGVKPLVDSVRAVLWRFTDCAGRATRAEFWYWLLVCLVLIGVSGLIRLQLMTAAVLGMMMIGTTTVALRRLHDSGRSGHWLWMAGAIFPLALVYLLWAFKIIEDNWAVLVYKLNDLALAENEPDRFNTALIALKDSWLNLDTQHFSQFVLGSLLLYLVGLVVMLVLLAMPSKESARKMQ